MENIEIERFECPKLDAYLSNNNQYFGTFNNEHEFNKFRVQMLLKEVTNDYYFMWGDIKITVDSDGNMDKFPRGLYDRVQVDLCNIFKIQQNKKNNIPLDYGLYE